MNHTLYWQSVFSQRRELRQHFESRSQNCGKKRLLTLSRLDVTLFVAFVNSVRDAKITQTRIRETSYHSVKLHLKQVFQSVYRHELETKLSQKPWKQEIANITDWPRRKVVAEFRLFVGHDCLGIHLHRIGIRPDPYCMLCSLREPMDRNHLGCTALFKGVSGILGGQDKNDGKLT